MVQALLRTDRLVPLLLLLVALGYGVAWMWAGDMARELAQRGVAAAARIEAMREVPRSSYTKHGGARSWTDHVVTYAFEDAGGAAQRVERVVPPEVYWTLEVGEVVEVLHLPDDPSTVEVYPGEWSRRSWVQGRMALLVASLAIGLAVLVAGLGRLMIATRLPPGRRGALVILSVAVVSVFAFSTPLVVLLV